MSRESAVDKSAYGNNKLAQWGVADDQLTSVQQWLAFASMMLLGVVSVHQYMMVSPVLTFIGDEYGMTLGNVGFMMSVFNIAGLILVYPAAALLRKFGVKFSLILTVVVSLLGNIMSLAATGVEMFLVARTLQGCGFGLIGVVGNNLIPRLMPASKIGLSMGIWGQWFPGGVFLATFTTPALYAAFGWRSLFVMSLILFVITAVLLLVWFKLPRVPENVVVQGKKNAVRKFTKTHFKSAMLIIVAFLSWGIVYNAINSFYPTYAQDVYNMSVADASFTTMFVTILSVPMGIIAGALADKLVRRKAFLLVGYALFAIISAFMLWCNTPNPALMWTGLAILGAICGAIIPTITRTIIPVLAMSPEHTDIALASQLVGTTAGGIIAGFFGTLVAGTSYATAGMVTAILPVLSFVIVLLCKSDRGINLDDYSVIEETE